MNVQNSIVWVNKYKYDKMLSDKVAIIGCGNIGLSIINGLLKEKTLQPDNITATRRNIGELSQLEGTGVKLTTDNVTAVKNSSLIVIAVKPYNIEGVLSEIKDHLIAGHHILISVTAGIPLSQISKSVGNEVTVFRAMPNISASVGKSVSCICHNGASAEETESVKALFDYVGTTMTIEEDLMESATILGACGIAYVLRFIRAMIQGGIQIGFDAVTASAIVNQTVKGAAELLIEGHQHPEFEIDKVTTPKGCTIVGLNEMEHNGFSSSLIKGLVASFEKIEK
jgi:pyrroline-5-carboxylate reductase